LFKLIKNLIDVKMQNNFALNRQELNWVFIMI